MPLLPLPIDPIVPDALARLRASRALVLVAEPGAGKTTRIPPAIVKADLLSREHPKVILLQPRRVAARAAAARIAEENRWDIGREVGYQIRFEKRIARDTRLHVMTEGILARQLLDDPILEGVGCVILDEFHERSLHTDLAIALLREVQQTVRPDLMLVVMSATLEAEPVARFLGDCPILKSEGRTFPVEITHAGATPRMELPARIASLVHELDRQGDVLVFLPGVGEINRTMDAIGVRDDQLVLPLHGSLSGDEQFAALRPADKRKIILATNIAETSLTIDGVRTVIDSGLARVAGFDPVRGMDRLELKRISRASAMQRAGRAGRTAPGKCIRLWSAMEDKSLEDFETPEIRRVDLTATVLALHAWGHADPRTFGWYEAPDERTLASAEQLLEMLGATTSETCGKITAIGRKLLSLPVHPRLGRLLLAAAELGLAREGAAIAALLSEKDILRRSPDRHPSTMAASDLLIRLDILESRRRDDEVDRGALRQVELARNELEKLAPSPRRGGGRGEGEMTEDQARTSPRNISPLTPTLSPQGEREPAQMLLRLPLWAYPDRVCRRREKDPAAGVMVGGSGVRLAPESVVRQHEFFLALDARQDQRNSSREAIVSMASGIEVEWLEEMFPQEIRRERVVAFDQHRQRVVGRGTVCYRDLPLSEDTDAAVDAEQAGAILAGALRPRAAEFFTDDAIANWLHRVALLRQHMAEHPWPRFDDAELADVLGEACAGKRSVEEVKRVPLLDLLAARLHYPLNRLLEQHAPETMSVPSGSRIRLQYSHAGPPVLAVRLQELFGWTETPRIAGGRAAVRLHLLGPNFRPVQITDDLKSFWATTYFQVRKDLRGKVSETCVARGPAFGQTRSEGRQETTMKAWLLEGLGGLEKLKLGEIADPRAGEGELVLRVHYAALNPADRYLAEGQYPARPSFPHILGRDGNGEVIEIGPSVSGWKVGDAGLLLRSEVGVNRHGTFAEKVIVPAESLARVPAGWTEQEAAGAPLVYLTAYQALTQFGELPKGSVVLITGASGGVGVASIQLAAAMGCRPIALSRGTSKRDALLKLGAAGVFDPTDPTWRKKLKESFGGDKVDLAIDNIGGEFFNDVIDTLGNNGKVSVVGRLAGPVPQFNTASLLFRRITIRGVVVSGYTAAESQQVWAKIVSILNQGNMKPVVDSVFPFEKLLDAFERLRQGPLGKVLLEGPK